MKEVCQPRIPYPAKLHFKNEEQIKTFSKNKPEGNYQQYTCPERNGKTKFRQRENDIGH